MGETPNLNESIVTTDQTRPKETYDSHEAREKEVMGAGYEAHEKAEEKSWGSHSFPKANNAHGYGHGVDRRDGHLRNSGHPQAHRIGKRSK